MLDNYKLIILAGGFHHCDPDWSKAITTVERCFKLYIPAAGTASIGTDNGSCSLVAGRVYFISGFRLKTQRCPHRLDVHWVHFMPESLYLQYLLDQVAPVQHWSREDDLWSPAACEELTRMFPPYGGRIQSPREDPSPTAECRIQGLLLVTVARLLGTLDARTLESFHPKYHLLKPALDYMQAHYQQNPSLRDVAARVNLAPNYFHRTFTALFKISPFNYMLNQRLNKARHLLSSTSLSVKEIAEATGYDNPLYFSRVFTSQLDISPSRYRALTSESSDLGARKNTCRTGR